MHFQPGNLLSSALLSPLPVCVFLFFLLDSCSSSASLKLTECFLLSASLTLQSLLRCKGSVLLLRCDLACVWCVLFSACMRRTPLQGGRGVGMGGLISDNLASFGLACFHMFPLLWVSDATHCRRPSNDVLRFFLNRTHQTRCCLSVRLFLLPVTEFSVCPVRGGMPAAHAEGQRVQVRLGGGRWSQLVSNDSLPPLM